MPALVRLLDRGVLAAGTEVGGYMIVREIADGGMGTIYEAEHRLLPRRAALKVLHLHLVDQFGAAERVTQEARILEQVQHAGVVRVFDAGELPDGRPWFAMEFLDGATLGQRLSRMRKLPPAEVVEVMRQVVETLAVAHASGVVHRDLKPDNLVLLATAEGGTQVKLIDWGVALVAERSRRLTEVGLTPGTPDYMSPEQARGAVLGGSCDVYALGVIATELLTGELPFTGANAIEIVVKHLTQSPPAIHPKCPDVPRLLELTILRMMSKVPETRPSIDELRFTLDLIAVRMRAEALAREDEPDIEIELHIELDEVEDELDELIGQLELAVA